MGQTMENTEIPEVADGLTNRFYRELRDYAKSRRNDVARGAETPELAALLVEKYASGLIKGAQLLDFPLEGFQKEIDSTVLAIDPNFFENQKLRWAARPATLSLS